MYNSQNVANTIKKLLLDKGITAKEMCVACSLGVNTLSNIRRGDVKSIETFQIISDYLDVSIDYLLGRDAPNALKLPYSGNNDVDSIINDLLSKDITDGDLEVIKAVLNKYK